MKKIGLITYHASHNYGSVLQSYAMQYLLKNRLEKEVEIIDFSTVNQKKLYSLFVDFDTFRHCVRNVLVAVLYPLFKKRVKAFEEFIHKELMLSPHHYEKTEQLTGIEDNYDILVTGSDQVWNTNCIDFDDAYFLSFASHTKKVAYAPSLGGTNILEGPEREIKKYRAYLNDFSYISSREKNGRAILEKLTGRNIEVVLDPTLCVEPHVWEHMASPREFSGDYIFYYGGIYHPKTYDALKYISNKLGLPIITIDFKSYMFRGGMFKGLKVARNGSPNNYLSLIKYAKYVITNSLHGTIFSTIMRRDFWVLTFKGTNPFDDRIDSLLEQLGFPDRKVYIEDIATTDFTKKVNYNIDYSHFHDLKQKSLKYLAEALQD